MYILECNNSYKQEDKSVDSVYTYGGCTLLSNFLFSIIIGDCIINFMF